MNIERPFYIQQLAAKSWNGKVKIITGVRRSGKSFLLSTLYKEHLIKQGVKNDCFVTVDLEKAQYAEYRNPLLLKDFVLSKTKDKRRRYYVFIDEIQRSFRIKNTNIDEKMVPEEDRDLLYTTFYDVLSDLMAQPNIDVYVTGSNSKMLSKDIVTNFRDRGCEIKVFPLSFQEYFPVSGLDKTDALEQYLTFGGMPLAVLEPDEIEKSKYLADLHKNMFMKDIVERYKLKDDVIISSLTDVIYSAVGSLSNPHKLTNSVGSLMQQTTSDHTIKSYLDYLEDAYLIGSVNRYDVKGKRYFENIKKYYATDLGLRNARLNFRQQERSHLMENLIYNELTRKGYNVDIGVVEVKQSQYEIDFIVNSSNGKMYIQSALNVDSAEKRDQELFSLRNTNDFFRKIVILDGNSKSWINDEGITFAGVIPFLLGELDF